MRRRRRRREEEEEDGVFVGTAADFVAADIRAESKVLAGTHTHRHSRSRTLEQQAADVPVR
jgi:hypothetical protein